MSHKSNYHYFTRRGYEVRELVNGIGFSIRIEGEWCEVNTKGMNRQRAALALTKAFDTIESGNGIF